MLALKSCRATILTKHYFTPAARHLVREARRTRTDQAVAELASVIAEMHAAGVTSLHTIASPLNKRGIPTMAGSGRWYHTQVGRLLARLARRPAP
jgi:hypothetical protein